MTKPYVVTLTVVSTFEYTVDANTPEEAVSTAERDFEDGVPMDMLCQQLDGSEVVEQEEG